MAQKILSLDIRDDLICGVMAVVTPRSASVVSCGASVLDEKGFSEALADVLLHVDYNDEPCRVCVGPEHFFYRNLSFPFSDKRKIDKILPIELEDYIAVSIDSLIIDSLVFKKEGGKSDAIAAMLDSSFIAHLLHELAEHNIDPEIVTISGAQTALQLGRKHGVTGDYVLVDLGCKKLSMFVVSGDRLQLIRTIAHDDGSRANFHLDRNSQLASARKVEAVDSSFAEVCRHIHQTLYTTPEIEVDIPVFLTGSLAHNPQAKSMMEKYLPQKIELCDLVQPPVNIGLGCGAWRADIMTAPLALALRSASKQKGFNFRKGPFVKKASLKAVKKLAPRLGIPLLLCLVVAIAYLWNDYSIKGKELARYEQERQQIFTSTLPHVKKVTGDPVRQMKVEVQEMKKGMLGDVSSFPDLKMLDLMAEISVRIPSSINVHVVRFVADRNGVLLRGLTDNFNSVDSLQQVLKNSPYFESVTINSANLVKKSAGVRFELKLQLNRG